MSETVVINAKIGTRAYKMKVTKSNEEIVRASLKNIEQKLHDFKISFPGRDEQDYLAMTLIDHISSSQNTNTTSTNTETIEQLQKISSLLDI